MYLGSIGPQPEFAIKNQDNFNLHGFGRKVLILIEKENYTETEHRKRTANKDAFRAKQHDMLYVNLAL